MLEENICEWSNWYYRFIIAATSKTKLGRLQVQGLLGLQSEFKASLGNLVRLHLKMKVREKTSSIVGVVLVLFYHVPQY